MDRSERPDLFVFRLGRERFALPLGRVDAAVRAAYAEPLPGAPELVLGILDLHGEPVPVIDLGRRFGCPGRPVSSRDVFLIVRTPRRAMALRVTAVDGPRRSAPGGVVVDGHVPVVSGVAGVAVLDEGLSLIFDLDACLSLDDHDRLDAALTQPAVETADG